MRKWTPLSFSLLLLSHPLPALGDYSVGQLLDGLEWSERYLFIKDVPRNEGIGKGKIGTVALDFLTNRAEVGQILKQNAGIPYNPSVVGGAERPLKDSKSPFDIAWHVLDYAATWEHLREAPASDLLQVFFAEKLSLNPSSQGLAAALRGRILEDVAKRYQGNPDSMPSFTRWLSKCRAISSLPGPSFLSSLEQREYQTCLNAFGSATPPVLKAVNATGPCAGWFRGRANFPPIKAVTESATLAIQVGGQIVRFPVPCGFAQLNGIRDDMDQMFSRLLPGDGGEMALVLGTEEAAASVRRGRRPSMQYNIVLTTRPGISKADFASGLQLVRQAVSHPAYGNAMQHSMQETAANATEVLQSKTDMPASITSDQSKMLGIDAYGENFLCYSLLTKGQLIVGSRKEERLKKMSYCLTHMADSLLSVTAQCTVESDADLQWPQDAIEYISRRLRLSSTSARN